MSVMGPEQEASYEVLDAGRGDDHGDRGQVEETTLLDLGTTTSGDQPSVLRDTPIPAWQPWAMLAAVCVVGALLGGYVSHLQSEAAPSVDDVVVVGFNPTGSRSGTPRMQLDLVNVGASPVVVRSLAVPEWNAGRELKLNLEPGEQSSTQLLVEGACNGAEPAELNVEAETDNGTHSGALMLPPADQWANRVAEVCEMQRPMVFLNYLAGVSSSNIGIRGGENTPGGSEFAHGFGVRAHPVDVELTDVRIAADGMEATVSGLPAVVGSEPVDPDGSDSLLPVEWRVTDCAAASAMRAVDVTVEYIADGETVTRSFALDYVGLVEAARVVAVECDL